MEQVKLARSTGHDHCPGILLKISAPDTSLNSLVRHCCPSDQKYAGSLAPIVIAQDKILVSPRALGADRFVFKKWSLFLILLSRCTAPGFK